VAGHVSKNLQFLRDTFGSGSLFAPEDQDQFTVDGVEFVCDYDTGSTPERFILVKPARFAAAYRTLIERFAGSSIVELGIAEGGSTALIAVAVAPRRLLAFDIEPVRVPALDELVARRGLGDVVVAHYGVDQSDGQRLGALVDEGLAGDVLDAVIDDASHDVGLTRASFDTLFPRLRPGGTYVIEDWQNDLVFQAAVAEALRASGPEVREELRAQIQAQAQGGAATPAPAERRPLADLVVEAMIACALDTPSGIAEVRITPFWIEVVRDDRPLDPQGYHLSDLAPDHYHYLG
jgi:predicted O-methyltransferase YrrM